MTILSQDKDLREKLARDMVYQGAPDFALIARDINDIGLALDECRRENIPVTVCGSQTSMTGASAADSGLALSLTRLNKIIDIGPSGNHGEGYAVVEPGVILGDLKDAARAAGFFYPPDPTSFREATIGATLATNATGEDTFLYGPTRRYIESIDVLKADGGSVTLTRSHPAPEFPIKNTAGYFLDGENIDTFIGSEGTLGIVTRLRVRLLSARNRNFILLILPFENFPACLSAVEHLVKNKAPARALELIGPGASTYFRACPACPEELKSSDIFLYVKIEINDESGPQKALDDWLPRLERMYGEAGEPYQMQNIFAAQTAAQQEAIRLCRHFIPLKVNEEYFPYTTSGGGKVGTDWWVPTHHLRQMMLPVFEEAQQLQIPFLVFGHIGNGHPHWNFLTRSPEEKTHAKNFVLEQCRRTVLYGGGVAGEHGIGKIKRNLLEIQHAPKVIAKMRELKSRWDPKWILGRGNIL